MIKKCLMLLLCSGSFILAMERVEEKTYYGILGVSKDATADQIKANYRKLALACHPDRNPQDRGATVKFQELAHAYEILSDGEKRKKYDTSLKAANGTPFSTGYTFKDALAVFASCFDEKASFSTNALTILHSLAADYMAKNGWPQPQPETETSAFNYTPASQGTGVRPNLRMHFDDTK